MTTLLEVRGLSKYYDEFPALKDVSFQLQSGELLALIGPNGAGKTTCFNAINGQLEKTSGQVIFNGNDISRLPPHKLWRLGVGRTFQITANFLSMSVIENVQVALINWHSGMLNIFKRARKQHEQRALELLELVNLAQHKDQACSILAYGDLKRLELAVAMANHPKLLLMDEPTAGMGISERAELMDLTHKIANERNIGVLFTEHDMDAVFGHADRIIVLHRGELIASGNADEIRNDPRVREVYLGEEINEAA
ncbi:MAG: ABC transporter ATP-binding protein [Gammaproteobacteria bacterium]|nr:ABC transporter ATP-binding protein [Gammaproteobacteria bacterium]